VCSFHTLCTHEVTLSGTLSAVPNNFSPEIRVIVGAAIIADGRVLACERSEPPEVAGRWEFPGGKVEPGESDEEALIRECDEELAVTVTIGQRIGDDIMLGHGRAVLRVYAAAIVEGTPQLIEHAELRWLAADELNSVPWLPADAPIVAALPEILARTSPSPLDA
jgi:8-oxo-dGTP diphosphatase